MSGLLNRADVHVSTTAITTSNDLPLFSNTTVPPFTSASLSMSESQATSQSPQTAGTQALPVEETQARTDLFNVLANLQQNSVELGALLQQQPHLLHGGYSMH